MKKLYLILFLLVFGLTNVISQINFVKVFPGNFSSNEIYSISLTSDNGYVILVKDTLMKLDQNGNLIWKKVNTNFAQSASLTSDNGFILSGNYLQKLNSDGNQEWIGSTIISGIDVKQTLDGGYAIAKSNFSIIKTNSTGNIEWTSPIFSTMPSDHPKSIIVTPDSGYAIAGQIYYLNTESKYFLVKTNSTGNQVWSKTFNTTNQSDWASQLTNTIDNNIVCMGSLAFNYSIKKFKISDGTVLWSRGFTLNDLSEGISISADGNGNYFAIGDSYNEPLSEYQIDLIKLDSLGNTIWSKKFGTGTKSMGGKVMATPDGGCIFAGTCNLNSDYDGNLYVVKTDANGYNEITNPFFTELKVNLYPSPASNFLNIDFLMSEPVNEAVVALIDITGKMVYNQTQNIENNSSKIDLENINPGLYFLNVTSTENTNIFSGKILIEK